LSADNGKEVKYLKVNTEALKNLSDAKGWSIPALAVKLGIDYSYLFRVINGQKSAGTKLFSGIYRLCKQENLSIDDYIFLEQTLSVDNEMPKIQSSA
jgi:transcriptional regulator with XRE-family HTH domain